MTVDMFSYFLGKKVRVIRRSNGFVYVGVLKKFSPEGIIIDDRYLGPTFMPTSDISEINEFKDFREYKESSEDQHFG